MTTTADLLVELLCEELPAKAVANLATGLRDALSLRLEKAGIAHARDQAEALWTPRRIAVRISGVALSQPEQTSERRGPALAAAMGADGQPSKALIGFAASAGVAVEALEKLETDKGAWFVHRSVKPGALTADVLPAIVRESIQSLPLGKPMRWGDNEFAFLRPVHGLVILLGDSVLSADVYGVHSGRRTRGHRFHHPDEVVLARPADYVTALEAAHVLVDPVQRRERVRAQVAAAAITRGGIARLPDDLIDEVSNLTEWPSAIACTIPADFMRLPKAVIMTTIETHQRFFPVLDADGALLPAFVGVANIESRDPDEIRKGYERVVRPRLADAAFFFDQDLRQPLGELVEGLKTVTYQQKLGSTYAKSERVATLARALAPVLGVDADQAQQAALLAKADLLTRVVGEFPELQGQMGRAYAHAQGLNGAIADALEEVYSPQQAGTPIARSALGRVLAIAERLDTLAGIFAVGQKPTGNKDPFALRRAALGLARTLIEGGISLPLDKAIGAAIGQARHAIEAHATAAAPATDDGALLTEILDFVFERTRAYYQDSGITADVFDAVAARKINDLVDFDRRLNAVLVFKGLPACQSLAAANKRIRNILRKAAERGVDVAALPAVDVSLFDHPSEHALHAAVESAETESAPHFAAGEYIQGLTRLAQLQLPVDAFFADVMVMAEDLSVRDNRLALLDRVSTLFLKTADVSLLS